MSQINKPSEYFNTVLWTGDNTDNRSITGVGFQPDMVWQKTRNQGYSHSIFDNVRGVTKRLVPNDTAAETTVTDFKSFDSDGFTIDQDALQLNATGDTNVGWSWLGGGTASSNTDGSITSQVSANTTSGFSIVSYTGTGAVGNIGHGLGSTPKIIIKKRRNGADAWNVWHESLGDGSKALFLNTTNATDTNANYASNVPTSSLFYVGTDSQINASGGTYIAYCFAEKKGYSKFGSYTGNGSTDGTFVYTGFKPAFVMSKCTSAAGEDWNINDNKRPGYNVIQNALLPNSSSAEVTASYQAIDTLSNGFKWRGDNARVNGSGNTYIYMAFAERSLVGTNNVPALAR